MLKQIRTQLRRPDSRTLVLAAGPMQAKHILRSAGRAVSTTPGLKGARVVWSHHSIICDDKGSALHVAVQDDIEKYAGFAFTGLLFVHECADINIIKAARLVRSRSVLKPIIQELEKEGTE